MKNLYLASIVAALVLSGASLAHDDVGTPKNYCEAVSEHDTHDYVAGVSQFYLSDNMDGNQGGNCDGTWALGTLCPSVGSDPIRDTRLVCGFNELQGDYDGHSEFAVGGAAIYVHGGDGASSGTLACYGELGHHSDFGPAVVNDTVLGMGVTFYVMAQGPSAAPTPGPQCGDNVLQPCSSITDFAGLTCDQNDIVTRCVGTCTVTYAPGVDGAYLVFVEAGAAGHIFWQVGGSNGGSWAGWALPGDRPTVGTADP